MSKVTFKYPFDVQAECRVTGFKGTITCRTEAINGSIQYGLQPRISKEDSTYVPDAKAIDEDNVVGVAGLTLDEVKDEVDFKFDCGQRVKNIVNGFEGVVVCRLQWMNGCIQYTVEGPMVASQLTGMADQKHKYWEQELKLIEPTKAPPAIEIKERKRTGGPMNTLKAESSI